MDHVREMDAMIRNIAVCGDRESYNRGLSFYDISWKALGQYLFVYIEDLTDYYFRLFDCGKTDAIYDRRLVLDPSYDDDENYKCLYDHKESQYSDPFVYIADGKWYDDLKQVVDYYYQE